MPTPRPLDLEPTRLAPPASIRALPGLADGTERRRWRGNVVAHTEHGSFPLQGLELGRTTMLVRGGWRLYEGAAATLELQIDGARVFIVAVVDLSRDLGGQAECLWRFSVTSPEANDLLARAQDHRVGRAPTVRNLDAAELETVITLRPRGIEMAEAA